MERASLHLLVVLLAFSHLILFSIAVPSTRDQKLLHGTRDLQALADSSQVTIEEGTMEGVIDGRVDLEKDDYPGSGANNRHTPKPPGRR